MSASVCGHSRKARLPTPCVASLIDPNLEVRVGREKACMRSLAGDEELRQGALRRSPPSNCHQLAQQPGRRNVADGTGGCRREESRARSQGLTERGGLSSFFEEATSLDVPRRGGLAARQNRRGLRSCLHINSACVWAMSREGRHEESHSRRMGEGRGGRR